MGISERPSPVSGAFSNRLPESRIIKGKTIPASFEATSEVFDVRGCRSFTFFTFSNQAGSLQPQIRLFDGTWFDLGAAVAITASTLNITTFSHTAIEVRVLYTPTVTGTVDVQVLASPDARI